MKTIFVSAFEGVEAKNILRTSVLQTLLNDTQVRVVLLMKNEERIQHYQREFHDARLIYQAVPEYHRGTVSWIDSIFGGLKFFLLNTETTALRRRMVFEEEGGYVSYYLGSLLKFIFARSLVRKIVRFFDFYLVRNSSYEKYFDTYKPDLVFLAHLFEEPEIHILREAKRRRVKSVGFVNSWDKVTARCIMRLLPDKAIVFNDLVKDQVARFDDMHPKDITVTGIPQYDYYRSGGPSLSREAFCKQIGIDPAHKIIVYAPIGSAFSASDWEVIDFLDSAVKREVFGQGVSLLVRFQPNDFLDEAELKRRPHLVYDYPGTRFTSTRGVDWDMDTVDLAHLKSTLLWMDILICYASSLSVDAAVFDKPVININFEFKKSASPSKSPTKFYGMTHYKDALLSGGIRLVESKEDLVTWATRYLADASIDREGRTRLVREQCFLTDGGAGARIGETLRHLMGF